MNTPGTPIRHSFGTVPQNTGTAPRFISTAPQEMDSQDSIYDVNNTELSCQLADRSLQNVRHKRVLDGIQRTGFIRMVRDITQEIVTSELETRLPGQEPPQFKFTKDSCETLHLSSEAFLEGIIYDASLCMAHGKRVTLMDKDLRLARRLRGHVTDQFT